MKKIIEWMSNSFAPKLNKLTRNIWVTSIQDTFQQVLPMILVGSLVSLISTLKNYLHFLPDLSTISNFSFGLLGIFVAFLIPYNILEKRKVNRYKLIAGFTNVALLLLLSKPKVDGANLSFEAARLGAGGLFVALITGLLVGWFMSAVFKKGILPKNTSLPDIVAGWFESLIPIFIVLLAGWIVSYVVGFDAFTIIQTITAPLVKIAESYPGFVLMYFACVFIFGFGISAWSLTPVLYTVYFYGIAQNAKLVAAGKAATYISTLEVQFVGWCAIGGLGCTLTLCVMMLLSKSKKISAVGKAAIVPSIFNINEPIVYGLPIAWNPIMMIPFWINGFIVPSIVYFVLRGGLVTVPSKPFAMQFLPQPISTFLVNNDFRGVILWVILVVITALVWYPFFKAYEKMEIAKEAGEQK